MIQLTFSGSFSHDNSIPSNLSQFDIESSYEEGQVLKHINTANITRFLDIDYKNGLKHVFGLTGASISKTVCFTVFLYKM